MNTISPDDTLKQLINATTPADILTILRMLGDHPDLAMDEPFGHLGYFWHPFGNNPSNFSTIGLATKAGRSLTERLTNAIDAILEQRGHTLTSSMPRSPRTAAQTWYGRPISGPDSGLYQWDFSSQGYDKKVHILMSASGEAGKATIDVIDQGIGLRPVEFSNTILSLQAGNKIKKFYLIGSFGQGGASTLAFCDYAVIISRPYDDPTQVSFTVIKVLNLDNTYKDDSYVYLCTRNEAGELCVPSIHVDGSQDIDLYSTDLRNIPTLKYGTLARHISYKLPSVDGMLGPSPGNLYHYLHYSLFDPLLPFRITDLRQDEKERNELITGSRNRLMRLVESSSGEPYGNESGNTIRHYRPMEYLVPPGATDASIGIEYWVVFNYRKSNERIVLRSHSNELFVLKGFPIVGTLNGQNQGELSARHLKDIGLSMTSRHIVVHVDASNANSQVRRELFSTSREGFKDGDVLTCVIDSIRTMLSEDEELQKVERELTEKLTKEEAHSASDEVKKQVTKLLKEAGLQVRAQGTTQQSGGTGEQTVVEKKRRKYKPQPPLPTLPFPQATHFSIVYPDDLLQIRTNEAELILVETDADAEFDKRGLIAIRSEPDLLVVAHKAPLRGGRIRWRMRTNQAAAIGDTGKLYATLTKPDGTQLKDEIDFEVQAPIEKPSTENEGFIPPFDIKPINPEDDPETWETIWPDYSESATPTQQTKVAYKPMNMGGKIVVYYSTIFQPFKKQIDHYKNSSPSLADPFVKNYEIWIAYHAILQETSNKNLPLEIEDESLDQIREDERNRVATMQVKQAVYTANISNELLKSKMEND